MLSDQVPKPLSDRPTACGGNLPAFDWTFNPAISRVQIETLAACDVVRRRQNLVFVGQSGVGKSHLIQSIGQAACTLGFRVHYLTSGALLEVR